ncbi:MAG: heavy metal translocating P-type ATPase [Thaumarchaeota archaeon]|nr:heavy metal translocating P-type ATPase [Nitrososphaerota archaeon]
MAKDPVCGMFVDEVTTDLKAEVRGTTYYFCSASCMHGFLEPEKELRRLKVGLLASASLSVPILLFTYSSLLPSHLNDYVLFALETPLQFAVGWRFYIGTLDGVRSRTGNMDVLIALGTSAAWAYSTLVTFDPSFSPYSGVYFDTSAVIITLILAGRYLEHLTKNRASAAVRELVDLRPSIAHRIDEGGKEEEVPVEDVKVGDLLVVRPGEKIPVDSVVLEGRSAVDESAITGESDPADKASGDEVIGGTINESGFLKVKAEKVGQDTTLSQIVKLVEEAQVGRAPIQRTADRIAAYFVPAVIAAASIAAVSWYFVGHIGLNFSVLVFVSVVVISCPCALGVATPAALLVGTSKGAQSGILIKGGDYLERAAKVDTVVFDKTGTLTTGRPTVTDVVPLDREGADELLALAASVESGSGHPLGEAVVAAASGRSALLSASHDFVSLAGGVRARVGDKTVALGNRRLLKDQGGELPLDVEGRMLDLEAEGKTVMGIIVDGKIRGIIAVADTLRTSAVPTVAALKKMGITVMMLTGDNEGTASAVALKAGIDKYAAQVTPQMKEDVIASLRREGRVVAMVGDGINDAPALARADVGIAIGSGTDIAKETGGIVLIKDDLRNVATALKLSRKTLAKIRENLFWAFAYNVVLIPVAAGALVPVFGAQVYGVLPFLAAAAMAVSSATVIGNSLLLFRFSPDSP